MTKKAAVILFTLSVFGLAWAAADKSVEKVGAAFATHFDKGFYVGPANPNPTNDNQNKVGRMLGGAITFDFASVTITCEDSTGITVTGAQVNDPCFVGPPTTISGAGTGLHSSFTCYVSAANTVKVRHCAAGTADNPASAIYEVRVISNNL